MTKKPHNDLVGMGFDEALTRLLRTDPSELADQHARLKNTVEEIRADGKKRKELVARAGRANRKRFHI